MPDENTLQEICDIGGDPAIIAYIDRFRKDFARYGADTLFRHKYAFAFGCILMGEFSGGKLLWRPETRLTAFMKNGIMYDINGVHEPDGMFYVPAESIPFASLVNEDSSGIKPATQLQVMDAVECWRDIIRIVLKTAKGLKGRILTIKELNEFAERHLYIKPDGISWIEQLYAACVSAKYRHDCPNEQAMAVVLNDIEHTDKDPYFCQTIRDIDGVDLDLDQDQDLPTPSTCKFQHLNNGAVRCVMKSGFYSKGSVRATIQLNRNKGGFTWEINSWFNELTDELDRPGKGKGWGRACLTALAKELIGQYAEPYEISYVWNGQNDYVGHLVTDKWGGICVTPIAVLKNESADSWDNHVYRLNKKKFMQWLGLDS